MNSEFLSHFTQRQKRIAGFLCIIIIFSMIAGAVLTTTASFGDPSDYLAVPEEALENQENELSQKAKLLFVQSRNELRNGNYQKALDTIQEAIDLDGDVPLLVAQRASVYVAMEQYNLAVNDYSTLLSRYPEYTMLYQLRGALYTKLELYDLAFGDYTRYLEETSNDTETLMAHTNLAIMLQKYTSALTDINQLLKLQPSNGILLALKGDILSLLSRTDEAISIYQKAIEYLDGSTLYAVWSELGNIYQMKGDYAQAVTAYSNSLSGSPDSGETWFQLGICQIQTSDYTNASGAFSKALELNYEPALSHFQRGLCNYSLEKYAEAASDLQVFADTSSSNAQAAYIYLALSHTILGNTDTAISYFDKCLSNSLNEPESHYYLGMLYLQKRNCIQAISHFTDSIRLNCQKASSYYNRGIAYLYQDDFERARKDFQTSAATTDDPSLAVSAQNILAQMDSSSEQIHVQQDGASAPVSSSTPDTKKEQSYHTVIIKNGTLENPSAIIDQSSENYQTSE